MGVAAGWDEGYVLTNDEGGRTLANLLGGEAAIDHQFAASDK